MSELEHKHEAPGAAAAPQDGQFAQGVELLSRALKTVFILLAGAIIIMLLWFLTCGGSFIVDSTKEAVVVLQFGKFHAEYGNGWHWFLPYPINKIVRIPIIKQEVITKSFMASNSAKLYNPNAQQNEMMAPDTLSPGKDGYTLLGDNSIMHSDWKMTYRISDPKKYFLNCMSRETAVSNNPASGPDAERVTLNMASTMLKNILDDAVISVSAGREIENTYFRKSEYEDAVRLRLIQDIEAADLGITLESLNMLLVAPPIQTFQSFQQLVLSQAERETMLEEARTFAVEQKNIAETESTKIRAVAEAYKTRVVSQVIAEAGYFQEILKQFNENPEATYVSLFYGPLANAMVPVKDKFIIGTPSGANQALWLKLNQEPEMRRSPANNDHAPEGGAK